jgi:hypothetical protein
MAYAVAGLNLVGGSKAGQSPQVWTYQSNDPIGTIDGAGYFNNAASILKVGDLIYVYSSADTVPGFGFVVVNANSGTVVDVTSVVTVGTIDSD